jgi:tetratricopeptide (TPR) repeat protein
VPKNSRLHTSYTSLKIIGACVFLAILTWVVFGQTLTHDFVNYDDPDYVYNNSQITSGFTLDGVTWAFTRSHSNNWHPLTWLTHMLDWQLHGRNAGGHHFTNVLLHTTSVMLLFLVLVQMTGALWRSSFVAALFAIHPLHVESVAWITERKDALSGVFFMLTLWTYVRYARQQTLGRYAVMCLLFAFGLMSKPMLVTLPFVLLLLDYWPLNRTRSQKSEARGQWCVVYRLVKEKIPLLLLSGASCVATFLAQGEAISPIARLPFWWRVSNALLSYVVYLRQMLWPVGLAPFYTYPQKLSGLEVALSIMLLIAITAAAIALRRMHRYLPTGWFWYVGMLVPVIGIVQVGSQAHADRYTYLPQIGLYLAITWAIADLAKALRRRWTLPVAAIAVIVVLSWSASLQASYWRDSESLWKHTLAVTPNNEVAHNQLGNLCLERGQIEEAAHHYQAAVNVWPNNPTFQANLGKALLRKGLPDEAILHFQKAIELSPRHAESERAQAQSNIGNALLQKGSVDEAMVQFQEALELTPADRIIHNDCGNALLQKGLVDEAIAQFQAALDARVEDNYTAHIHYNLGNALRQGKRLNEAVAHYQEALKRQPQLVQAQNQLA